MPANDDILQHLTTLDTDMPFDAMRDELVYHFGISRGEANDIVDAFRSSRDAAGVEFEDSFYLHLGGR